MKYLIIASDIGLTTPGIVYETMIRELSKTIDVSVITLRVNKGISMQVSFLPTVHKSSSYAMLEYVIMMIFGKNFIDYYWLNRQKKIINSHTILEQDVIISFCSFHNYASIILGYYLSKKFNKKWLIYSVDAVPAPMNWVRSHRYFNNTRRYITKFITKCDAFFSSNEQMLKYQVSLIPDLPIVRGVLYTPTHLSYNNDTDNKEINTRCVFLYAGSIYGPRKVEALLEGFRLFLQENTAAKLVFVGIKKHTVFNSCLDLIASHHVEIYDFTPNLTEFYNKATVLIDINAYFCNDVYLSSKIVNYLTVYKPIISITGDNSPARNIFTEDPSIIHCIHSSTAICDAFKKASLNRFDYSKRAKYVEMFSPQNVIMVLNETVARILDNE